MSDDYARATGQPRSIELNGVTYKVARLRPSIVGELEAWMKDATPNPKAEARKYMDGLPDEVAKHVWTLACEDARDWPPSVLSVKGERLLLETFDGQVKLVHCLLRRHLPAFTLEDARNVANDLDPADFIRLFEASLPNEVGDPKATEGAAADAP